MWGALKTLHWEKLDTKGHMLQDSTDMKMSRAGKPVEQKVAWGSGALEKNGGDCYRAWYFSLEWWKCSKIDWWCCIKNHWLASLRWVNSIVCELHLNTTVTKTCFLLRYTISKFAKPGAISRSSAHPTGPSQPSVAPFLGFLGFLGFLDTLAFTSLISPCIRIYKNSCSPCQK